MHYTTITYAFCSISASTAYALLVPILYKPGTIMLDACWGAKGYRLTEYGVKEYKMGTASGSQGVKRGGVQVNCLSALSLSLPLPPSLSLSLPLLAEGVVMLGDG
jgi:hypothetical protein